ncbi:MAG: ROK family protein [Granulosicoccus sp.]
MNSFVNPEIQGRSVALLLSDLGYNRVACRRRIVAATDLERVDDVMDLNPKPGVRCFDVGGSKIVAANVSLDGSVSELVRVKTPIDDFERFCRSIQALCTDDHSPICLSIAGVINPSTAMITSANIPCLSGRKLSLELNRYLSRPVTLINDANAFALAEARYGKASGHDIVLAIILGTGVGGSIVVNRQILGGVNGNAGEWGHSAATALRTAAVLPKLSCNCGQSACVDTLGGARGLERLYRHFALIRSGNEESNTPVPSSPDCFELDSESILKAWSNREPLALHVVDIWLDIVGGALVSAINLLGASIVAVGGGLANNEALISALDKEVRQRCLNSYATPLLYTAVGGAESALVGAAIAARHPTNQAV